MVKETKSSILRSGDGKKRDLSKLTSAYNNARTATKIYEAASKASGTIRSIGRQKAVNKVTSIASRGYDNTRKAYEKTGGKFTPIGGVAAPIHVITDTSKTRNTKTFGYAQRGETGLHKAKRK